MTPTKDQIEAAAKAEAANAWNEGDPRRSTTAYDFKLGALWMQVEMEKLIEQRERAAWDARENAVVMDATGAWVLERNLTFEDWKKTQ